MLVVTILSTIVYDRCTIESLDLLDTDHNIEKKECFDILLTNVCHPFCIKSPTLHIINLLYQFCSKITEITYLFYSEFCY